MSETTQNTSFMIIIYLQAHKTHELYTKWEGEEVKKIILYDSLLA
jgi:hypothetical protein